MSESSRNAGLPDTSDRSGPKRRGAGSASHNMTFRYGFHSVRMSAGPTRRQRTGSVYIQGTAYQRVCGDHCARDHRFRRAAETNRRRSRSRPDGAFVRVDGPANFLRQEHGCHILCGASGLRRAVEIDQPSLLRVLLEHVDVPVLEDDDAVPLGLVDPLAGLRVDVGLVGGDGMVRRAPAAHELVDGGRSDE